MSAATDPTLGLAFVAGLGSVLSPCVLPVVPAFLAHLGGTGLDEVEGSGAAADGAGATDSLAGDSTGRSGGSAGRSGHPVSHTRWRTFAHAALFVLGFTAVFAVLSVLLQATFAGASATLLRWLSRLAGVVIVGLGLHVTGLVRFERLERRYAVGPIEGLDPGPLASLAFGGAFAVGWTPCVGPLLGSVLALAAVRPGAALPLLFAYGLGLGVPFLAMGAFPAALPARLRGHGAGLARLRAAFGYVLVALGVLVFTRQLEVVAEWFLLREVAL